MLFVALVKVRAGTAQERAARRMEWEIPEGIKGVAEYWLETPDPNVVSVFEADHIAQIWTLYQGWDDVFDITVHPAITAEDGLEVLKQMMST